MTALDDALALLEAEGYTVTPPPPEPWEATLTVWPAKHPERSTSVTYPDAQEALEAFLRGVPPGYAASLTHSPPSTTH